MIRKSRMSNVRSVWLYLHKASVPLMKFNYKNEFFMRFYEIIQICLSQKNSSREKKILNYITSRNMSRTLVPSNFMNEDKVLIEQSKLNYSKKKGTVGLVLLNFKQPKKYIISPISQNILKFHSKTMLLGNLVSIKETQEELEISWGGPEIYKLITFVKNVDEVVEKNSEVLLLFSAYWCQHCQRLRKPFGHAALMAKEADLRVLFATFDVTTDPDVAVEKGVVGIPLIRYYKKGKFVSTYRGKRTAEDIFEFVKNPPAPAPDTEKADI